ncbi:hypothetical protein [Paraburkholderia youngii]|uniref:hypothetical protein n=1 Tax=Paraburkholderia youngii TaxID=2782701 RepID=UPI003D22D290
MTDKPKRGGNSAEADQALRGLASLLFDREQAEEDVRAPYFGSGLRYALLFANELVQVLDTELGVTISAFNNTCSLGS